MAEIKQIKKNIENNKKSIKKAKEKVDAIRKEELIEQLAGLK